LIVFETQTKIQELRQSCHSGRARRACRVAYKVPAPRRGFP